MKSLKKIITTATILGLTLLVTTACDWFKKNDAAPATHIELTTSSPARDDSNFAPWNYVSNGESLVVTFDINKDKSTAGIKISGITFYLDNSELAIAKTLPYTLTYPIENKEIGALSFRAVFNTSAKGYADTEATYSTQVYVSKEPPVLKFNYDYPKNLRNGEEFTFGVDIDETTTFDISIVNVTFSWDKKILYTATTEPYVWTHTFTDETKGEHELTITTHYNGELGARENLRTDKITVE